MATCNYCGGTITAGVELCPHCGGDLTLAGGSNNIKIENQRAFSIRASFKPYFILRKNIVLFIIIPILAVPVALSILFMIPLLASHAQVITPGQGIFFNVVIYISIPLSFIGMLYIYARKAAMTKCDVSDKVIEYNTGSGGNKMVEPKDVVSVDSSQTELQNKYNIGTIKMILKPGGLANLKEIQNVDDFKNSFVKLKSFIDSVQNNNK
ncbi:MAG TPA: zinc ribbon domain-containing protein [Bacteroidia bacterium]|jgi:hypothetical protein|nr:zinc ribbon domain-containing protein [Bacteroidia bacterium]